MINNMVLFLLETILGILTLAFLLRFYFQLTRASFQHPLAELIVTLTNFAVKPTRRVLPSVGKWDISTLLLAYLTQLIIFVLSLIMKGFPLLVAGSQIWWIVVLFGLIKVISLSVSIFLYAVLIQAVLSWINPMTPIAPTLNSLTMPILRVLRKYIPAAGQFDLSPLVFIILAQLLLTTILLPIENTLLAAM